MDLNIIGRPIPRVDGLQKATGVARYTDDLTVPGMLMGGVCLSPWAHARNVRVHDYAVREMEGVAAVITSHDLEDPGITWLKQPVLASGTVRFGGEALALVAADTKVNLVRALSVFQADGESLPCIDGLDSAQDADVRFYDHQETNYIEDSHWKVHKGRGADVLDTCEFLLEETFQTQCVEHMYLETECALAVPQDDGSMLIQSAVQHPYLASEAVATILGLPMQKVRVIHPYVGGSFGGKLEAATLVCIWAALLARTTGRPVKLRLDREQSIKVSSKRHPFAMHYRVGAGRDGSLRVLCADIQSAGGAYGFETPFVNWRAAVHSAGCYRIPHVDVRVDGYYTNQSRSGAFRGFSSPQIIFGQESLMDELAVQLGLSVLEVRRRNVLRVQDETATGHKLDTQSVPILHMMDTMTRETSFEEVRRRFDEENQRREEERDPIRSGIGIAISYRGCGFGAESPDATGAYLCMRPDGSVLLRTGLTDIGQGLATALSQIAAETLGIRFESLVMDQVDTAAMPDGGLTVASRGTFTGGKAVQMAAAELKKKLLQSASALMDVHLLNLDIRDDMIFDRNRPEHRMTIREVAHRGYWNGEPLVAQIWLNRFTDGSTDWDKDRGCGKAYPTYTYSCVISQVTVNRMIGSVHVDKISAGHDVGRAINPALARGQVYGGIAMGLGMALLEEVHHEHCLPVNLNFDTYRIPTAADMPEDIRITLFESDDPFGPFHAKSLGEASSEAVAASIANAISHATSLRVKSLPVSPEKLCSWIRERGDEPCAD